MDSSDGKDWKSVLLPYAEAWGSHANSPYPAWTLSGLFAISAPLSVVAAVPSPTPIGPVGQGSVGSTLAKAAASTSSSATTQAGRTYAGSSIVAAARAPLAALPPFYQLVGFSAVFAGGGYIVKQGDSLNGSGVMSAWSMLFLFFRLIPSLRPRAPAQPLPFILSSSTLAIGSIYAAHYFSRTSWRGAAPFTPPPAPKAAARNAEKKGKALADMTERVGTDSSYALGLRRGTGTTTTSSTASTSASTRIVVGDERNIHNALFPWLQSPSQYMNIELAKMAQPLISRHPKPSLTVSFFNYVVKQQVPVIAAQTLLVGEIIRKVHVDYRMGVRARKRGHLNVSELLYMTIKCFAIVAVILDCVLQESTILATPKACHAASSASTFLWYTSSTLVAAALAWRTYIIFGRSRRALRLLLGGLALQFTMTILAICKTHKLMLIDDGYCDYDEEQFMDLKRPWYHLAAPWFIFVTFLFDASVVTASTYKIVSGARSPLGFSALARVLITNGVQYAALVCTTNFIEFILIATVSHKIPSLLNLSITIQIITGLNLIAEEQDAVHGYTCSQAHNGPKHYEYASDKSPALPRTNRTGASRDTGSVSGYGISTTQHDYKEGMYPSMICEDPDVVEMHTCVDVEARSDRSDPQSGPISADSAPHHSRSPSVPWEITMGSSSVRRKPAPIPTAGGAKVRHTIAYSPTEAEQSHTSSVQPGLTLNGGGGDGVDGGADIEMQERPSTTTTTSMSNTLGLERAGSVAHSISRSSSFQRAASSSAGGGEGAPIPNTPMGGVSIRSIRQAIERGTTLDVPMYARPDSTLEVIPTSSQWPNNRTGE
ncbi:hypothetical protein A4X03_0g1090 [Tilletia caries]|uniref:Uncharacterized protein n=1 Tax=Tilletia caries TaxID=13290 RepID=A0A8T8TP69_9BASI|nr:hypothetical protein A4X03_0g1090 [Tilletia caries]